MADQPSAFHDLPEGAFPFKVEFFTRTGAVVHSVTVPGPGALRLPGLSPLWGPVGVRVTYATGQVAEIPPPSGLP